MPTVEFGESSQFVNDNRTSHWQIDAFDDNFFITAHHYVTLGSFYVEVFEVDDDGVHVTHQQHEIASSSTNARGDVCCLDSTHAVIVWWGGGALQARAVSRSGVTLTSGAAVTVEAVSPGFASITALSSSKALVVYLHAGTVKACVLDVTGTTVTVGTPTTVDTAITADGPELDTLDSTHAVVFYPPSARVLTVSGTTVTVGSATSVCGASEKAFGVTVVSSTVAAAHHRDGTSGEGKVTKLAISGTSLTVVGSAVTSDLSIHSDASYGGIAAVDERYVLTSYLQVADGRMHIDLVDVTAATPATVAFDESEQTNVEYNAACVATASRGMSVCRHDNTLASIIVIVIVFAPASRPRLRGRHTPNAVRIRGREKGVTPSAPRMRGRQAT